MKTQETTRHQGTRLSKTEGEGRDARFMKPENSYTLVVLSAAVVETAAVDC